MVAGWRTEDHSEKERGEISWYRLLLGPAERAPALGHLSGTLCFLAHVSYSSSAMGQILSENPHDMITKVYS